MSRFLPFILMLVVLGCASSSAPVARVDAPPNTTGAPVEAYVTNGDGSTLLQRQPDLRFVDPGSDTLPAIVVNVAERYQEMVGFGAALTDASSWLMQNKQSVSQRDSLLQLLFGREPGAGFSFVRLPMGASDFSMQQYSYDDVPSGGTDPALKLFSIDADRAARIPILKRARTLNPRLAIMASPWSAPGWMKTTDRLIKGTLRPEAYAPFAEYFHKFVDAYAAEGIPIYAITIQNEPHFEPENYPGMRLDPAARAKFIGQYLGPVFANSAIATRILEWDHNWNEPTSPLAVLADSFARRYVAAVAWHCYSGDVSAQGQVHDAYPAKDVFFTECSGGDWAPRFGDNLVWMVRTLIIGSTRNWARGVLMWNLALDENHGPHTGGCGNCRGMATINSSTGTFALNEEYYAFAHASRFVRPGARRIASTSGVQGLESVAFRNADDSTTAVIVVNTNPLPKPFTVRVAARALYYNLGPQSVVTFRWK